MRDTAQEQEFQNLLVSREVEVINCDTFPDREEYRARLADIEKKLHQLGWDGIERTRHP